VIVCDCRCDTVGEEDGSIEVVGANLADILDTSLRLNEIKGFNNGSGLGITLRRIVGEVVGSIEGTIVGLRVCTTEEGVTVDEEGKS